jgi:hypothetical protein
MNTRWEQWISACKKRWPGYVSRVRKTAIHFLEKVIWAMIYIVQK